MTTTTKCRQSSSSPPRRTGRKHPTTKWKPSSSISSRWTWNLNRQTLRQTLAWRNSISWGRMRLGFTVARSFVWNRRSVTNGIGTYRPGLDSYVTLPERRLTFFDVVRTRNPFVVFFSATCFSIIGRSWPQFLILVTAAVGSALAFPTAPKRRQTQQQQPANSKKDSIISTKSSRRFFLQQWSLRFVQSSAFVLWRSLSWSARRLRQLFQSNQDLPV